MTKTLQKLCMAASRFLSTDVSTHTRAEIMLAHLGGRVTAIYGNPSSSGSQHSAATIQLHNYYDDGGVGNSRHSIVHDVQLSSIRRQNAEGDPMVIDSIERKEIRIINSTSLPTFASSLPDLICDPFLWLGCRILTLAEYWRKDLRRAELFHRTPCDFIEVKWQENCYFRFHQE